MFGKKALHWKSRLGTTNIWKPRILITNETDHIYNFGHCVTHNLDPQPPPPPLKFFENLNCAAQTNVPPILYMYFVKKKTKKNKQGARGERHNTPNGFVILPVLLKILYLVYHKFNNRKINIETMFAM